MSQPNTANWIRLGLLALPLYGVLTFWPSLDPQPDPNTDYEAWSHYVSTNYYVLKHLLGSGLGLILAIFGTFALGAYLANSRAGRLGLVAMVITVLGYTMFLMPIGASTFAAPEEGQAYLAGIEEFESPDLPCCGRRTHCDGRRSAASLTGRKAEGSVVVPVRERRRATRIVRQ